LGTDEPRRFAPPTAEVRRPAASSSLESGSARASVDRAAGDLDAGRGGRLSDSRAAWGLAASGLC